MSLTWGSLVRALRGYKAGTVLLTTQPVSIPAPVISATMDGISTIEVGVVTFPAEANLVRLEYKLSTNSVWIPGPANLVEADFPIVVEVGTEPTAGTWNFRAIGYNVYTESAPSEIASAQTDTPVVAPTAPTLSAPTAISSTQITVTIAGGSGADLWTAQRSPAGAGTWTDVGAVAVGSASYTYGSLSASTAYDLRIVASNTEDSANSNTVTQTTSASDATPLFSDDFERSAIVGASQNNINWSGFGNNPFGAGSITTDRPKSGTRSVRMRYLASSDTQDSSVELRMAPSGVQWTEYCVRYFLYLPANFNHRNASGSDNTKGIMQSWSGTYGAVASNQYIGFEYWPNGDGSSYLTFRAGRDGVDLAHTANGGEAGSGNMFRLTERGKWIQIRIHVVLASGVGQTNGTIRAWKWVEGEASPELLFTKTNWGYSTRGNFIESFYFLGWSNSGFTEQTDFFIDRFAIHDELLEWEAF